jgi:hypothetical protein
MATSGAERLITGNASMARTVSLTTSPPAFQMAARSAARERSWSSMIDTFQRG